MTILTDEELVQYRVRAETDMVKVVNRVSRPVEWLWDSKVYTIEVGGSRIVPRAAAISGITVNALKMDSGTHSVAVSAIGMTGLNGEVTGYPISNITIKEEDKYEKEIMDSMKTSAAFPGKKLEAVAVLS